VPIGESQRLAIPNPTGVDHHLIHHSAEPIDHRHHVPITMRIHPDHPLDPTSLICEHTNHLHVRDSGAGRDSQQ
jgi:hypothetical protein